MESEKNGHKMADRLNGWSVRKLAKRYEGEERGKEFALGIGWRCWEIAKVAACCCCLYLKMFDSVEVFFVKKKYQNQTRKEKGKWIDELFLIIKNIMKEKERKNVDKSLDKENKVIVWE